MSWFMSKAIKTAIRRKMTSTENKINLHIVMIFVNTIKTNLSVSVLRKLEFKDRVKGVYYGCILAVHEVYN